MKIQLKRSNVLEGGSAKQPTAQQMEFGELAVNYNAADPTLFIKDSADKIIPIAGSSYILNIIEENQQINISPTPPTSPAPINGDLWLDMTECPPELKVWSDCSGTGEWETIGGGAPQLIDPTPGDGNNSITPMPPGSGTLANPYVLTAVETTLGGSVQTVETISFSNQKAGTFVQFVDQNSGANGNRYSQPIGVIGADGSWSGKLYFTDLPASTVDAAFTGLLKIGESSIYYSWNVACLEDTEIETPSVLTPPNGAGLGPGTPYNPETSVITNATTGTNDFGITWTGGTNTNTGGANGDGTTGDNMFDGDTDTRWFMTFNQNGASTYTMPSTYTNNSGESQKIQIEVWSHMPSAHSVYLDLNGTTIGDINVTETGKKIFEIDLANNASFNGVGLTGTFNMPNVGNFGIHRVGINGKWIGASSTTLTLTDDKAYNAAGEEQDTLVNAFEVGDTVTAKGGGIDGAPYQNGVKSEHGNINTLTGSFDNIFDGSEEASNWLTLNWDNGTGAIEYTLPSELPFNQTIEGVMNVGNRWAGGGALVIQFKDENGTIVSRKTFTSDSDSKTTETFTREDGTTKGIKSIYVSGTPLLSAGQSTSFSWYTLSIDGNLVTTNPTTGTVNDVVGNTMILSSPSGDWTGATKAINDIEKTKDAPGADDIVFTSTVPTVTNGSVTTWGTAEWQLAKDATYTSDLQTASIPITVDNAIQQVPDGTFTLEDDTQYYARVRYTSNEPSVASSYSLSGHTFKTASGDVSIDVALGGLTKLYTGNGTTQDVVTGSDLETSGGMLWIKALAKVGNSSISDSERISFAPLSPNTSDAEGSSIDILSFNKDGFTTRNLTGWTNDSGDALAAWSFPRVPGFFDVVEYVGTNVQQDIPHSLGIKPGFIIVKKTTKASNWPCYHKSLSPTNILTFNSNTSASGASNYFVQEPTDTHFTVGTGNPQVNDLGEKHTAYLFADSPGVIECGRYQPLGPALVVQTGFQPQWILIKKHTVGTPLGDWCLFDTSRSTDADPLQGTNYIYRTNLANGQITNRNALDFRNDGFRVSGNDPYIGESGAAYVYIAIAAPTTRYFYDESLNTAVVGAHIIQRYGLDPETNDMRHLGIYPLDQQPNFAVDAFVKEGDKYRVVRDRSTEVSSLQSRLEAVLSRVSDLDGLEENPAPETPQAIDGYYPLYTSEAEANSAGNGTSHTHLFNDITYYMPNGVTFYHGNYDGY